MTYLLSISIGPVQEFIAAARRTADLRAGSQLLQQLAGHIAQEIEQRGGQLIFPASANVPGPNKVVAEIASDQPAEVVKQLKESAVQWLLQKWQRARERLTAEDVLTNDPLAQEQVRGFLEFYAAWVPFDGDYATSRERVEALLAGRKALRNFVQPSSSAGLPKSPLDPSRDGVLVLNRNGSSYSVPLSAQQASSLRLKKTEFLDAISLLKRVQEARDVPSTSLMAAQSVLPVAEKHVPQAVETLRAVVRETGGLVDLGDLMFPNRLEEEMPTSPVLRERRGDIGSARKKILESVRLPECPPYYVVLVADGDRMGRLISAQRTVEQHRALSQSLAQVAQRMTEAIRRHNGYCVYAGGDDVLALLPVNQSLECAEELARLFREAIRPFVPNRDTGGTLSVGIAIVHHLESLQRAVGWAREAEKLAKGKRNALAVAFHPRGGAPLSAVTSWQDAPYLENWHTWVQAFRQGLSHGFPYELLHLARESEGSGLAMQHLRDEALRIFDRKQGREAKENMAQFRKQLDMELQSTSEAEGVQHLAHRLIIARFLSRYPEVSA